MKPVVFVAAGLGAASVTAASAYAVKTLLSEGGLFANFAHSQNFESPRSVSEPESLLLLGAGLLAIAWWRRSAIAARLFK